MKKAKILSTHLVHSEDFGRVIFAGITDDDIGFVTQWLSGGGGGVRVLRLTNS